jgi:hypothetical protein
MNVRQNAISKQRRLEKIIEDKMNELTFTKELKLRIKKTFEEFEVDPKKFMRGTFIEDAQLMNMQIDQLSKEISAIEKKHYI